MFVCSYTCLLQLLALYILVNLQFAKLERLIYGLYSPGMRMRSRIFRTYVGRRAMPEEVGHDAYLRHSHMTLVCNYAATRSKECHLRV